VDVLHNPLMDSLKVHHHFFIHVMGPGCGSGHVLGREPCGNLTLDEHHGAGGRIGRLEQSREHEPGELVEAIEALLVDPLLPGRLSGISGRLQADPGTVKAAGLIEALL